MKSKVLQLYKIGESTTLHKPSILPRDGHMLGLYTSTRAFNFTWRWIYAGLARWSLIIAQNPSGTARTPYKPDTAHGLKDWLWAVH